MSYTGEDVRRLAEQHIIEMRLCDQARWQMVQAFLARIREQEEKRVQLCRMKEKA